MRRFPCCFKMAGADALQGVGSADRAALYDLGRFPTLILAAFNPPSPPARGRVPGLPAGITRAAGAGWERPGHGRRGAANAARFRAAFPEEKGGVASQPRLPAEKRARGRLPTGPNPNGENEIGRAGVRERGAGFCRECGRCASAVKKRPRDGLSWGRSLVRGVAFGEERTTPRGQPYAPTYSPQASITGLRSSNRSVRRYAPSTPWTVCASAASASIGAFPRSALQSLNVERNP